MFLVLTAVFRIQKQERNALGTAPRSPGMPPAVRVGLRCHADDGLEDAMEMETAQTCQACQHIERRRGLAALYQPARGFNSCGVPRADRLLVRTASLTGTIAGSFRQLAAIEEADVLPSRQPSTAAGPAVHSRGQNATNEGSVGAAIAPQDGLPTLVVSREWRHIELRDCLAQDSADAHCSNHPTRQRLGKVCREVPRLSMVFSNSKARNDCCDALGELLQMFAIVKAHLPKRGPTGWANS